MRKAHRKASCRRLSRLCRGGRYAALARDARPVSSTSAGAGPRLRQGGRQLRAQASRRRRSRSTASRPRHCSRTGLRSQAPIWRAIRPPNGSSGRAARGAYGEVEEGPKAARARRWSCASIRRARSTSSTRAARSSSASTPISATERSPRCGSSRRRWSAKAGRLLRPASGRAPPEPPPGRRRPVDRAPSPGSGAGVLGRRRT